MPEVDYLDAFPSNALENLSDPSPSQKSKPSNMRSKNSRLLSSKSMPTTSRPKRPRTAFETYVRFEMMLNPVLKNESQLSVEESEVHWREWTNMPLWKKQVYQDLAAADEIRYKKELQTWQDSSSKNSTAKAGDFFKARLFQKKATSFHHSPSRSSPPSLETNLVVTAEEAV